MHCAKNILILISIINFNSTIVYVYGIHSFIFSLSFRSLKERTTLFLSLPVFISRFLKWLEICKNHFVNLFILSKNTFGFVSRQFYSTICFNAILFSNHFNFVIKHFNPFNYNCFKWKWKWIIFRKSWYSFVLGNQIKINDSCLFYLKKSIRYRVRLDDVHVYRKSNGKNNKGKILKARIFHIT